MILLMYFKFQSIEKAVCAISTTFKMFRKHLIAHNRRKHGDTFTESIFNHDLWSNRYLNISTMTQPLKIKTNQEGNTFKKIKKRKYSKSF